MKIHPAYGAVALLLTGQLVLGYAERKAALHFNSCVEEVRDTWSSTRRGDISDAVPFCNGQ